MPSCEFMAHSGSLDFHHAETRVASTLAARNIQSHNLMLDIFARRCMVAPKYKKLSFEALRQCIDAWMKDKGEINILPEEAVENGFADGVIGSKRYPSILQTWGALYG